VYDQIAELEKSKAHWADLADRYEQSGRPELAEDCREFAASRQRRIDKLLDKMEEAGVGGGLPGVCSQSAAED